METRFAEKDELTRRAVRALEHAHGLEPASTLTGLCPELRLWHYPSFSPWKSWTVMRADRRTGPRERCVRQVSWDMPADTLRLSDPMEGLRRGFHTRPTLTVCDAKVPIEEYDALLAAGSRKEMPLLGIAESIGLDGETFGIQRHSSWAGFRCEWWCDGPREWISFTRWAAEMRQLLERCVEEERL